MCWQAKDLDVLTKQWATWLTCLLTNCTQQLWKLDSFAGQLLKISPTSVFWNLLELMLSATGLQSISKIMLSNCMSEVQFISERRVIASASCDDGNPWNQADTGSYTKQTCFMENGSVHITLHMVNWWLGPEWIISKTLIWWS